MPGLCIFVLSVYILGTVMMKLGDYKDQRHISLLIQMILVLKMH